MRAVKDHHVDRPGVEVRQRMQLTGPNRPIGSISTPCAAIKDRYRTHTKTQQTIVSINPGTQHTHKASEPDLTAPTEAKTSGKVVVG